MDRVFYNKLSTQYEALSRPLHRVRSNAIREN